MKYLLTLVLFISLPLSAVAHGTGGTYEATIDGFLVDIGYTPEFVMTDSQVRFDFSALPETVSTSTVHDFTDVWVRVNLDNKLYFAGNINRPAFGPTGFSTILGEPGEYQVFARFQKDVESLVEVDFPLIVVEAESGGTVTFMLAGGAFLVSVLSFGIGFAVSRRKVSA